MQMNATSDSPVRLKEMSVPPERTLSPSHRRRGERGKLIHERCEHSLGCWSLFRHALPEKFPLTSPIDASANSFQRTMTNQMLKTLKRIVDNSEIGVILKQVNLEKCSIRKK